MSFFVVSRRALLRDMIASFCAGEGIKVHGVAEKLSDVSATSPNPIVLLHLGHGDAPEAGELEAFRQRFSEARIVVLCSPRMYARLQSMPKGLIEAMVLDNSSLRSLSGVLTLVHEGFMITRMETPETEIGPEPDQSASRPQDNPHDASRGGDPDEGAPDVGKEHKRRRRGKGASILSRRETAVIQKLCEGASNKDIANALNIGESTVKVHLHACYRKIGVRNRTQAAIWAAKHLS